MTSYPPDQTVRHHRHSFHSFYLTLGAQIISFFAQLGQKAEIKLAKKELRDRNEVDYWELEVPSRDNGRTVKVMVYRKKGEGAKDKGKGKESRGPPAGVHFNFHGSGFVIPSLGTDIEFCALLAHSLPNTYIFDCDYRKSPSTPFPGYFNDALDIISYVQSYPESYDSEKLTISGFSAGGGIAMSVATFLGPEVIKGLVNFYGNADLTKVDPAPENEFDYGIKLPDSIRSFFYNCTYLPDQDRRDPRISPTFTDVESWPKYILMSTGTGDNLYMSSYNLTERLKKETEERGLGMEIEFVPIKRAGHAWDKMTRKNKEAQKKKDDIYAKAVELVRKAQEG